MSNASKNNLPPKTRNLPMPVEAKQLYEVSEQSWKVLTEVTFPTAKTAEAIMMALDYCRTRKLDIFKKPVHVVPMWSAALGRSVETVWPSIMEIQTTASRTGVWAGIDRPVWGTDKTHTFSGRFKDENEQWQEKLGALEKELGQAFCGIAGDASELTILDKLFVAAIEHFGKSADIVVANAGRGLGGSVKDADLSKFEEVLKLNVTGTLALLQKAAQKMVDEQQSNYPDRAADIVIIGSVVGRHISPFSAVYGATKFAVHSLAEGLRREVGPKGIRVSLVEPGIVISGFQDAAGYGDDLVQVFNDKFGPLLHGDDVANAIHYIVTQPPHVHISDIVVRPTRQDYP